MSAHFLRKLSLIFVSREEVSHFLLFPLYVLLVDFFKNQNIPLVIS